MRKFIKQELAIVGSTFAGIITEMLILEKDNSKIKKETKFQCCNCPYEDKANCPENERILNEDEFVNHTPIIVSEHILYNVKRGYLGPLCLLFLHYDWDKSRVVCYSYKQEKVVYINVNYDDINNVKITVTAG